MGMTTAPSTGAISMRSLPLHKAGVGSAVNDTTRELGGALGVAVLGTLVASHFRSSFRGTVSGMPTDATHSLSEALQHAQMVGGARGSNIAIAARCPVRDRLRFHALDCNGRSDRGRWARGLAPASTGAGGLSTPR